MSSPSPMPERATYGFVLYLVAWICLGLYLLWAYIPDQILHSMGLYYLPQKYWALAVPTYVGISLVFAVIFYVSFNLIITPSLGSVYTIQDDQSRPIKTKPMQKGAVSTIGDMSISKVNKMLYGWKIR